eukprot:15363272-Ditylum_brightwellii.AAC.1
MISGVEGMILEDYLVQVDGAVDGSCVVERDFSSWAKNAYACKLHRQREEREEGVVNHVNI